MRFHDDDATRSVLVRVYNEMRTLCEVIESARAVDIPKPYFNLATPIPYRRADMMGVGAR